MSREGVPKGRRGDVPEPSPAEPEVAGTRRPLYRLKLSDQARSFLTSNIAVDVQVCATGEPCAKAADCGNQAHVKVTAPGDEVLTQVWCADHWLALRELYVAASDDHIHYGPGALNLIAMRRTPHPSDSGEDGEAPR